MRLSDTTSLCCVERAQVSKLTPVGHTRPELEEMPKTRILQCSPRSRDRACRYLRFVFEI
jgi:hypothetical protein